MIAEYNKTFKILMGSVAFLGLMSCGTGGSYPTTTNDNGKEPTLVLAPNSIYKNRSRSRNMNRSNPQNATRHTTNNTNTNNSNNNTKNSSNPSNAISKHKTGSSSGSASGGSGYTHVPKNTDVGNVQFEGYKYKGLLPSGKGAYYKVGKPYTIKGYHYAPHENYGYNVVGTVSWYGPGFQGGKTANGERFDTNTLAAASPILPLPSYVKVTNLSNGKQVIVRVNDRGPYASARIMDLSKKAAEILDYKNKGTTTVRVEILAPESKALKALLLGKKGVNIKGSGSYKLSEGTSKPKPKPNPINDHKNTPSTNSNANANPSNANPSNGGNSADDNDNNDKSSKNANPKAKPVHKRKQIIATSSDYSDSKTKSGNYYIQVGAYATEEKVRRISRKLATKFDSNIDLTKIHIKGQELYRIRFNNIKSETEARQLADSITDMGYSDPRITLQQ